MLLGRSFRSGMGTGRSALSCRARVKLRQRTGVSFTQGRDLRLMESFAVLPLLHWEARWAWVLFMCHGKFSLSTRDKLAMQHSLVREMRPSLCARGNAIVCTSTDLAGTDGAGYVVFLCSAAVWSSHQLHCSPFMLHEWVLLSACSSVQAASTGTSFFTRYPFILPSGSPHCDHMHIISYVII